MGNCKISRDLKECALQLWELGLEELDILQRLAVSCSSQYRWNTIFEEYNDIN
jgi:hypothetical protein